MASMPLKGVKDKDSFSKFFETFVKNLKHPEFLRFFSTKSVDE
jgi:hypothetical protein